MSAKRQLSDILEKLERIERQLDTIESQHKRRRLSFDACIPPPSMCRDIVLINSEKSYENIMEILSNYYGIKPMNNLHDPERVPKDAIACYYPSEATAYYKKPQSDLHLVLHEFFHHLVANSVVIVESKEEQKCADRFADLIIASGKCRE